MDLVGKLKFILYIKTEKIITFRGTKIMQKKSIIFMGTPEFAAASLKKLNADGFNITAVVTQPDKERGRGRKVTYSPVKELALELNYPVFQPISLRDADFLNDIRNIGADLLVIVAFRILPPAVIAIPTIGAVNLHASLLPKYRGAAPINHALFNGDTETGATIFFLNNGEVDSGGIIDRMVMPIQPEDNYGTLYYKLQQAGAEFLSSTVKKILEGSVESVPQAVDSAEITKAPKLFAEDFIIDWQKTAFEIHNKVRGLAPKPGAVTTFNGKKVKIIKTVLTSQAATEKGGIIKEVNRKGGYLLVSTGNNCLKIVEIQPEGKGVMTVSAYLNGCQVEVGTEFKSF